MRDRAGRRSRKSRHVSPEETGVASALLAVVDRAANGEPLTGLFRVRLENKLQEFQSQIAALGFYPQKELDALEAAQAAGNP